MMRRPEIEGFISVSPPANTDDFSFLAPCPSSGLIVHGDADEQVPIESVNKLAQKLSAQKNIEIDYAVMKNANHFFQDKIEDLDKEICRYLDQSLSPESEKKKAPKKKKK